MPVVSEITDPRQLPLFREGDVLQVGARNMQNFELLRELGRQEKPVLLKRSFGATVTELLQAAEYILDVYKRQAHSGPDPDPSPPRHR